MCLNNRTVIADWEGPDNLHIGNQLYRSHKKNKNISTTAHFKSQ